MHVVKVMTLTVVLAMGTTVAWATDLMPLTPVADESGFGTLYQSQSIPYTGGAFNGTLESRVYVDALPASQVTFVYDLKVNLGISGVADLAIAAVLPQNDLRIGEILGGTNGYIAATTSKIPDGADAYDNLYPTMDQLLYGWVGANMLKSGDGATLYVTTTGAVDVGVVDAAIQDGSVAHATVLAPVDDPSQPDLNVPEPATLVLLGIGACVALRRRH